MNKTTLSYEESFTSLSPEDIYRAALAESLLSRDQRTEEVGKFGLDCVQLHVVRRELTASHIMAMNVLVEVLGIDTTTRNEIEDQVQADVGRQSFRVVR